MITLSKSIENRNGELIVMQSSNAAIVDDVKGHRGLPHQKPCFETRL